MSMETDSPVVYHGTSESRFPKEEAERHSATLSMQEREILRQCNKESLYYRCLPLSFTGMTVVYLATKKGFFVPHPVWGPTFKMAGAGFLGWVIGKLSYRRKCEDKFLQLENSDIADMIRKQRGIIFERPQSNFPKSEFEDDSTMKDSSFSYYSDKDYHSSAGSLNLDMDKNIQYSGLDDRERPSTDRDSTQASQPESSRMYSTYDDLRRRNREEYLRPQRNPALSSTKSETGNMDSSPPRRYSSDFNEGDQRRSESNLWDNAKVL